jgi:hypothetical protein
MPRIARTWVIIAAVALLSARPGAGEVAPRHSETKPAVDHADLDQPIRELNLESSTLEQAIDTVRKATGANLIVYWEDLKAAGIRRDAPVKLHLWDVTLGRALSAILSVVDGDFASMHAVQDGVIVIGTPDRLKDAATDTRVYDVRDLVDTFLEFRRPSPTTEPASMQSSGANGTNVWPQNAQATAAEAVQALANLIEDSVAKDTWKDNGGNIGALHEFAGRLVIIQSPAAHRQIAALLRTLRAGGTKDGALLR